MQNNFTKAMEFNEGIKVALQDSKTIPIIVEIKHLYLEDKIISDKEKINLEFSSIARVERGYASLREDTDTPNIP